MSTSSNPLDALASPTPVSEAEEILAEPGRDTSVIAPVLMFQERAQFPDTINEVKTKDFVKTANIVQVVEGVEDVQLSVDLPIPQPSQESNFKPQAQGKL